MSEADNLITVPGMVDVFIVEEQFRVFYTDPLFFKHFSGPLPSVPKIEVASEYVREPVPIADLIRIFHERSKKPQLSLRHVMWLLMNGELEIQGTNLFCCCDNAGQDQVMFTSLSGSGWRVSLPEQPLVGKLFYML